MSEKTIDKWTHRITLIIFWIAFASILATSVPHVAWLYHVYEPQSGVGWWAVSYGIAVGIDVMIAWLSFISTLGKIKEVWFTWLFILALCALSWYANYLYDMQNNPVRQSDVWSIQLWSGMTTGTITPIIISAIPIFAIAYTFMLSKLGQRKIETTEEMKRRLAELKARKEVEAQIKELSRGRLTSGIKAAIDEGVDLVHHARKQLSSGAPEAIQPEAEDAREPQSTEADTGELEAINLDSTEPAEAIQEENQTDEAEIIEAQSNDLWYGFSSRAVVTIDQAAQLLNVESNRVKTLRSQGKLKTAARNRDLITIASIKAYKARQSKRSREDRKRALRVVN
jgi:hypothetical protein